MKPFAYYHKETIQEVFELLQEFESDAYLLAGGTDLLVRIKTGRFQPEAVIDIKGLRELSGMIERDGDTLRIPALTQMASLEYCELINQYFPALALAAASVGSVQIRNRATLAGNLCNASPAADTAPALLIYNAQVTCISTLGERTLALSDFVLGPGKTALALGEMVKEVILPIPTKDQVATFTRLTRRKGVDLATINLCCQVNTSGLTRFALGAVGPVPFMVEEADGVLASTTISLEDKKATIVELMKKAAPITDVRASKEYRQAMLAVLGQRALSTVLGKLQARQ